MGNIFNPYQKIYSIPYIAKYHKLYDAFQITAKELTQLHTIFSSLDEDQSGTIEVNELFRQLHIEETRFLKRIFRMMDEDGSGQIDFKEFVMSLWNYCTLSSATLELFAFDLYDNDSTGELSVDEIHQMLKEIYGNKSKDSNSNNTSGWNNHATEAVANDLIQCGKTGKFNIHTFHNFVQSHPAFLFPAFRIQHEMQLQILGVNFWKNIGKRRVRLDKRRGGRGGGAVIRLEELFRMNVNKDLYSHQIAQYRINDSLALKEPQDYESNGHATVSTILHYTGTHHYRHQIAVHENQPINPPPATIAHHPVLKPSRIVPINTNKGNNKKHKEDANSNHTTGDITTTTTTTSRTSTEDDDFSLHLMEQIKFEATPNEQDLLHEDIQIYEKVFEQSNNTKTRFIAVVPPSPRRIKVSTKPIGLLGKKKKSKQTVGNQQSTTGTTVISPLSPSAKKKK